MKINPDFALIPCISFLIFCSCHSNQWEEKNMDEQITFVRQSEGPTLCYSKSSGVLPVQMPANMETVETQLEDVSHDMACHVDELGNTYEFAYGLNWKGIISDERTAKYLKIK